MSKIEARMDVSIDHRGNRVSISGDLVRCGQAGQVLRHLYHRLMEQANLSESARGEVEMDTEIEGAIRSIEALEFTENPKTSPTDRSPAGPESRIRTRSALGLSGGAYISGLRKKISALTPAQDRFLDAMGRNEITFALGPAGTGKTFLAAAYGAGLLSSGEVSRMVLARPAVEAGERLGFLPGDLKEKVDPYMRPIYDALFEVLPADRVAKRIEAGVIEIVPLAFMRGRTLKDAFILLDEAQNTSVAQIKMFLTRIGSGSRMVLTGDPSQTDLPVGIESGLAYAANILQSCSGIEAVHFDAKDAVRHPLVRQILKAFEDAPAPTRTSKRT